MKILRNIRYLTEERGPLLKANKKAILRCMTEGLNDRFVVTSMVYHLLSVCTTKYNSVLRQYLVLNKTPDKLY